MNPLSAAKAAARPRVIAVLTATSAMAMAVGVAAAPSALAANPAPLPAPLSQQIASDGLPVQISNGWEAVTGPAPLVDNVRAEATSLGVGTLAAYTGYDQTGHAILIFTGNDNDPTGFRVTRGTIYSVANDTDQAWFAYADNGIPDAAVNAGAAANIPPVDATLINVPRFSFSPTAFSFWP